VPSSYIHVWVAGEIPAAAGVTGGEDDVGAAYFFGSVAPDVGLVAGSPRAQAHWWTPGEEASGRLGVSRLLAAHPELDANRLDAVGRAFVAGYLCHLVTDEVWIRTIYEPYFGPSTPFVASQEGIELQQALYSHLERRRIEAEVGTGARSTDWPWPAMLTRATRLAVREDSPPFTEAANVRLFLDALLALVSVPVGAERFRVWDRFRSGRLPTTPMAETVVGSRPIITLADRMPELEERVKQLVNESDLERFHARVNQEADCVVRSYLEVPASGR
jgi:hypothetical protein